MEVADLPKFFFDVAGFDFFREGAERFGAGVAGLERFENRFGGEHARLDRHVNAFEALRVEEAAGIADDQATVYVIARHGIPAAGGERLRSVADEFAAIENFFDVRVGLPLLKGFVRIELGVGVFEADDEADRDAIVGEAVDPAAAVHVGGYGPAECVRDVAGLDAAGLHVPQFFDANAINLRIDVVELVFFDELFGERTARAFGEDGDFGAEFVAGRVVVLGLTVFVDAFVFGDDTGDAVVFVDEFGAAELRE